MQLVCKRVEKYSKSALAKTDGASWKTNPSLLPNIQHGWDQKQTQRKNPSTSLPERRGGQLTFMETLFLDCSLAGVHYSSAVHRWNILCEMSAYANEDSALSRMSCFVKSCRSLSFQLVLFAVSALPTPLSPERWRYSRSFQRTKGWREQRHSFHCGTQHFKQPWLN